MFNPRRLSVEFRTGITDEKPVEGRKYTLTHCDETGELFLTVALTYAYDKINSMKRDEVFGEWKRVDKRFIFKIYVYVDGNGGKADAAKRERIFRKELPLALSAIKYGDRKFLEDNKNLLDSPIIVRFISAYDEFNKIENYGTFRNYNIRVDETRLEGNETKEELYKQESILDDNDPFINTFIVTILNPYIKEEVVKLYEKDVYYCLKDVELLEVAKMDTENKCEMNYKAYVGVKVGENQPLYNNFIIEFFITPTGILTKSVKNPR
ncbi:staygreen family protein [Clostridium sp. B9]|uniref:staygreen family protein n=1 Tax=Clostridium sp. B9 TaxID=3423224 RepID=UPI003D2EAE6B